MFPIIKTVSRCRFLYLEDSLGLGDHVGQALGGSQVLAQVPLVRAAQAVLPVTRPAATTQEQGQAHFYCLQLKAANILESRSGSVRLSHIHFRKSNHQTLHNYT